MSSFEKSHHINKLPLEKYGKKDLILGEGTYGKVIKRGNHFADKKAAIIDDLEISCSILREISNINRLDHPNIIYIIDVVMKNDSVHIIMPLAIADLHDYIIKNEDELKDIFYQMICGVNYCHSRGIIHRDIKPANFLIFKDRNIKLIDFGMSQTMITPLDRDLTELVTTIPFRAPEIFLEAKYTHKSDIWSLGVCMFYVSTKEYLFSNYSELFVLRKILQFFGDPVLTWPDIISCPQWDSKLFHNKTNSNIWPKIISEECSQILRNMIQLNPDNRVELTDIVKLKFFNEVRKSDFPKYTKYDMLMMRTRIPSHRTTEDHSELFDSLYKKNISSKNSHQTFFMSIDFFDRFTNSCDIENYELYGYACLYLSGIFNERWPPVCSKFHHKADLLTACKNIIETLDYDVTYSTGYDFILLYRDKYDENLTKIAIALLYTTIFTDLRFTYLNDDIALTCFFMAHCYVRESGEDFEYYFLEDIHSVIMKVIESHKIAIKIFEEIGKISANDFKLKLTKS